MKQSKKPRHSKNDEAFKLLAQTGLTISSATRIFIGFHYLNLIKYEQKYIQQIPACLRIKSLID
jgi:hypothetical protein